MKTNPNIFKAYDIRGIYGIDLGENTAYRLGLAYAKMRKKEINGENKNAAKLNIAVGADMRLSSPSLKKKLIAGLVDGGIDVVDIGLVSTPTFYFAVAHYKYGGGVLVSASHNPKEYNGFKLVREKAIPISGDTGMYILRDLAISPELKPGAKKGDITKKDNVLTEQIIHDLKFSRIEKIRPFKIAIDPANSMGSLYFDALFKNLPQCEIIKINWDLDGTFPAHEADPLKPENLKEISQKVKETGADLGIATDGDGDRIFFIDNEGEPVEAGIMRAIFCKIFLREKPGTKICYDIRPGKITLDTILENNGIPIVTKVGHSLIKEQALKEGAYFAGESSGHFFLNMPEGCYEIPVIATLKLLEELSNSSLKFSEYIKPFKKYFHSGEINSRVSDVKMKIKEIKEKYSGGKTNELDGIFIEYDNWWFNVRGSNTEPVIRLNLEAKTKKIMEEKRDEILKIINS
jgi:phosphomannomutase